MTHVLIMATNGFEQSELSGPRRLLEEAGISTSVASPEEGEIRGWNDKDWGEAVTVDLTIANANAGDYDALLLPGGQMNPDILRMDQQAIQLVKDFAQSDKPIAAICHAPWLLVEAGIIAGKTVTAWPSVRTDLTNAGADVVDREVAIDGNLITSRNPGDIQAFSDALIARLRQDVSEAA